MSLIVTGGGSGLGLAMSARFAKLGAKVTIASRSADRLAEGAKVIEEQTGQKVLTVPTDIRDPDACQAMVERAIQAHGPVRGLINNAAGNFLCASEDLSPGGFGTVVDIVLKGSWNATQAVGKHMIEHGEGGAMLSILTTYAWTGSAFVLPSAVAKAGVLAMTRSLAVEWGSAYKIRLNAIAPGPFPTDGAWSRLVPGGADLDEMKKKIPLGRYGEVGELADLAAFLMSPMASYINGDTITIDGGEWLQGAGEFNEFVKADRESLKQLFAAMKPKKG